MTRRKRLRLLADLCIVGAGAAAADRLTLTDSQWKQRLWPAQCDALRHEGPERAGTSALNAERRRGTHVCAGCDLPLFASDMKFESSTGWPRFFTTLPGAFGPTATRQVHAAACSGQSVRLSRRSCFGYMARHRRSSDGARWSIGLAIALSRRFGSSELAQLLDHLPRGLG